MFGKLQITMWIFNIGNSNAHDVDISKMPEAIQMKCNKCAKATVFEIEQGWDIPPEVVVAKCQRCENKGVREVTDFMKEPVRCTKCGAWKMEGLSCSICAKINAPSA